MTISPLMVELLFSQSIRWTCNSSKLTSRTFLLRGHLGASFPRVTSARGVDHQSKRRDMKIKSTFNISFQIRFCLFRLEHFHCFLNFIGCCLQFAYSMMQLFAEGSVDEVV